MVLSDVLQRFISQRPVAVMARAVLEKEFSDGFFDNVFDEVAEQQYTRDLAFSTCAKLMVQVTLGQQPSVHAAFIKERDAIPVSVGSLYAKLQGVETAVCEALVQRSSANLAEVVSLLERRDEPISGYRLRLLDGNVLAGSEHRLKELRGSAVAAMPGKSLVVYDYATGLISQLVACEDGQASERRLAPAVWDQLVASDLLMADRNFCTAEILSAVQERKAAFLIRHHAGLKLIWLGKPQSCGRCKTGIVQEAKVRLKCGLVCRGIVIIRDKPLASGGKRVVLLTNLPRQRVSARVVADLYLRRWTIEEAFRQLTEYLQCELRTLGYPRAALFGFTLAVLAYNGMVCVKAALRAAHTEGKDDWSSYYMAWEIRTTFEGMLVAVPAPEWLPFGSTSNKEFADFLRKTARAIDPARYAKHRRGPKTTAKRPKVRSRHVSTAKLLRQRRLQTTQALTS
jgi:hypothetical protein